MNGTITLTLLRFAALAVAVASCASTSSGPPAPGTLQVHMGGEIHTFVGAVGAN